MFSVAAIAIFIGMVLVLIRLYQGPTVYDRVVALNAFGTHTVLFIGVLGFLTGRPDFLDIALLYALINFVGTIGVLKFFRYRAIGDVSDRSLRERRKLRRHPRKNRLVRDRLMIRRSTRNKDAKQ